LYYNILSYKWTLASALDELIQINYRAARTDFSGMAAGCRWNHGPVAG
jgi:hypothetical protein